MSGFFSLYKTRLLVTACLLQNLIASAQTNLLLNGGFEDVNTCTEYTAECGVEGWFYLRDVKAQMLGNASIPGQETATKLFGANSFGIFYNWLGYRDFTPVIGTILPCGLQKGNRYTFKGIISALLNPKLILTPGICIGEKYYVPKRGFSKNLQPDKIILLNKIPESIFYRFEYSFIADGKEKYLTFGTFVEEDTIGSKKKLIGSQTVSLVLDNFQLIPEDARETTCPDFFLNKEEIYNYNFRHKEMDYSLYGRGELAIVFTNEDSNYITQIKEPPPPPSKSDTLKLGDVFFDFNKANLQQDALKLIEKYFIGNNTSGLLDSIYIEGHTDSVGSDSRNLKLSLERCESVRRWLLENNVIKPSFIKVHPYGKSKPVASNSSPQGRALNRRVEMIVFRKTEK